jgi:diguanylate cyclase (GGDEF)-like protein
MEIRILAWFNILSCTVYVSAFFINRRGHHNTAVFIVAGEVAVHNIIATFCLGWSSGFHYFLICILPLIFFSSTISKLLKMLVSGLLCLIYILLYNAFTSKMPIYIVENDLIRLLSIINIVIAFVAIASLAYFYNWAVDKAEAVLKNTNKKLSVLAATDHLTGVYNRRKMLEELNTSVESFKSFGTGFTIIMCDIDDFKKFNDQYGHNCGDLVLTTSAAVIKSQLSEEYSISRWGGEEFLILLPGANLQKAKELAEKLRKSVQDTSIIFNEKRVAITMTFGIYNYNSNITLEEAVNNADRALYDGKRKGKNCVVA